VLETAAIPTAVPRANMRIEPRTVTHFHGRYDRWSAFCDHRRRA
jgi:hypothetical protein